MQTGSIKENATSAKESANPDKIIGRYGRRGKTPEHRPAYPLMGALNFRQSLSEPVLRLLPMDANRIQFWS